MKAKCKAAGTLKDAVLLMLDSASNTTASKLIKNHRVTVDKAVRARPDFPVLLGQAIEIVPLSPTRGKTGKKINNLPFKVLYEDEHVVAVDKPSGLLSIATAKHEKTTLYRMVSDYVKATSDGEKLIFIVHRLDRDASGVMLFAKDQKTKRTLQKNWAKTEKVYHAVVQGKPPARQGTVKTFLCENSAHSVYVCKGTEKGAQEAVTHYVALKGAGRRRLLELRIDTGRKHQIRVHMAHLGCPIAGDQLYGTGKEDSLRGIALHSHSLTFDHPATGKRTTVKSLRPGHFARLL